GDASGVVRVRYEEGNYIRIAARQAQRLFYQANEEFKEALESILNPKWTRPCPPIIDQENYHPDGLVVRNVFTRTMPVLSSVFVAALVLGAIFHRPSPPTSMGDLSRVQGGPVNVEDANADREKTVINIKRSPDRPARRDHLIKPPLPDSGRVKVRQ